MGFPSRTIEAVAVAKTPSGEGGDGLGLVEWLMAEV